MGDTFDLGPQLVKVGISLAFVLCLLMLAVYALKRFGKWVKKPDGSSGIEILEQRPVGLKQYLLLVKAREQVLLLGLSPQGINLLTHLKEASGPSAPEEKMGQE
ncbi:MAG: flagellar biosynthetic protein FliO [Syntrophobacteraceae bacterium]